MSSEPEPEIGDVESTARWRVRWAEAAAIAALALVLNLAGNGSVSLWDRDEPRYAVCTREMLARGDWIFPTFNAEPRFHKPILIYWLMRAGFAIGGDNPFGARLVSVAAGTATCLLVLGLGRRMFGARVGFLGTAMLVTAPIMVIESKLATTDATLTLFLVANQFCLWELGSRPSRRLAAAFWVLIGLATLTKGPVGLALIACSGGVSWWCGGPVCMWKRLCWRWGLPLFALVTAPWLILVGLQSRGEFFKVALGQQVAERIMSGVEQHGGFPGYYIGSTLLMFHPWSALLPAAILGAWTRRKSNPVFGFLLGWIVGPLVLLECVRTKLIHYYLPAYPACALLAAWLVVSVAREGVNLRRWPLGRLGMGLLGGVGIGITAVFAAGAVVTPLSMRWPLLGTALVIGSGTLWGITLMYRTATERAILGLAATWALVMLTVSAWLLPAAEPYRTSQIIGRKLVRLVGEHSAHPVLLAFQEPSIIYAMGRTAPLIRTWKQFDNELDRHGEVVTAITYPRETVEFERRTHLEVEVLETVHNFNLNKGATQTLQLALIRRKRASAATAVPVLSRRETFLVK